MKTLYLVALSICCGVEAHALPHDPSDRAALFATCAGRLGAELRHGWLLSDPQVETLAAQQATMSDLLEAVAEPEQDVRLRALRIEARAAHDALLQRAAFAGDLVARDRAEALLAQCRFLMIG